MLEFMLWLMLLKRSYSLFILSLGKKKNNLKTIELIKSRNYDVIRDKYKDTPPSVRSVPIPKLQIFIKIFSTNLQSLHVK